MCREARHLIPRLERRHLTGGIYEKRPQGLIRLKGLDLQKDPAEKIQLTSGGFSSSQGIATPSIGRFQSPRLRFGLDHFHRQRQQRSRLGRTSALHALAGAHVRLGDAHGRVPATWRAES